VNHPRAGQPDDALAIALAALDRGAAINPRFASSLFERVERALVDQSLTETAHDRKPAMAQVITPYLCVHDAAAAIRWYADAFAAEVSNVIEWNGAIGHAELDVAGAVFYLADEAPSLGVVSPRAKGPGVTQSVVIDVAVVDNFVARAVDNGATLERPIEDSHGRRNGWIMDPFGHRWNVGTPIYSADKLAARRAPSEPYYITLTSPDVERGADFYAHVLGWQLTAPNRNGGRHVTNTQMPIGLRPPQIDYSSTAPGEIEMWFAVRDFDDALDRVRVAGGTVTKVTGYDSGREALCEDDQGVPFKLSEPAPGYDR
jgi:uncharacterized glyoxalase superfamily protein PhnB